jgi:superfamily II DNA helicase RecQ
MYGDAHAQFRGVQRQALDVIVGGCPRVVVVMRTVFMLPALAKMGGVTIVILPKTALQGDMRNGNSLFQPRMEVMSPQ